MVRRPGKAKSFTLLRFSEGFDMEAAQREKLAALLTQEQTAALVTQGEKWPTANLQAFAATLDLAGC
jgi:hypothetical protein